MAEGARNCKEDDGQGQKKNIMPENIIGILIRPSFGKPEAPESDSEGHDRAQHINDYDGNPGYSHAG